MTDCLNIHSLSWERMSEGQERINRNSSLIPTLSPSLIREGKTAFTLSEGATYALSLLNNQRKIAFTLAEVLITLGIIGVVAAMTMPALIGNYQKKQTVSALKKAYTTLAQAVKLSELSNGEVEYWDFSLSGDKFFNQYLSQFTTINNSTFNKQDINWKYLNGNDCVDNVCTGSSHIVFLSDGSLLMLSRNARTDLKAIAIDINGLKKPNTVGKDLFFFWITKYNGLQPFGAGNFTSIDGGGASQTFGEYDRETLTGNTSHACNKEKKGSWCTALIMMDGWEIKSDYPW